MVILCCTAKAIPDNTNFETSSMPNHCSIRLHPHANFVRQVEFLSTRNSYFYRHIEYFSATEWHQSWRHGNLWSQLIQTTDEVAWTENYIMEFLSTGWISIDIFSAEQLQDFFSTIIIILYVDNKTCSEILKRFGNLEA